MKTQLTSKEWRVYNLLKSDCNKWWSAQEIKEQVPDVIVVDDPRNPSPELTQMRIRLNESAETDKIITTKKHCFKIATLEEYLEERARHIKRLKNEVAQVEAQDTKYKQDGQGKLFNNVLNELKPNNEQFHETFMTEPEIAQPSEEVAQGDTLINASADNIVVAINSEFEIAYIITEDFMFNEKEQTIKIGEFERGGITDLTTMFGLENFYKDYERKEL